MKGKKFQLKKVLGGKSKEVTIKFYANEVKSRNTESSVQFSNPTCGFLFCFGF